MGPDVLPEWFLLAIAIAGIIGGVSMFVQWITRNVKASWQSGSRNGNGATHPSPPKSCPLDSGFVNSQLTSCEASREQSAMRDQEMLSLLRQILGVLQAIQKDNHEIQRGITLLLDRTEAARDR